MECPDLARFCRSGHDPVAAALPLEAAHIHNPGENGCLRGWSSTDWGRRLNESDPLYGRSTTPYPKVAKVWIDTKIPDIVSNGNKGGRQWKTNWRPVQFITSEIEDDFILSFYVASPHDPGLGRSIILMRDKKWEHLVAESERGGEGI